jgi:penicillin-binding protein 1A
MTSIHSGRRRAYAALGTAILLAGAAGGAWLALKRTSGPQIDITFLGSDGQEIGKRGPQAGPQSAHGPDYFLDWAEGEVQRLVRGRNEQTLTARTTLDSALQEQAERAIENSLAESGVRYKVNQAALVSLGIPDGAIRAMAGGRDYSKSRVNYAAEAKRQTGSSFFPYVYLTALEGGATPGQAISDKPVACGDWQPTNYNSGYGGAVTLSTALAQSTNTVAVSLSLNEAYGGRKQVLANLQKMGVEGLRQTCSLALGDQGITLLNHTGGYLHFANGGKSAKPYAIVELRNSRGEVLYSHERDEAPQQQIFSRAAIENLNGMLRAAVTDGTGKAAALEFTPVAGKTGTSSGSRDAWFAGFTGLYVTGVWFGNEDYASTDGLKGADLPASTWRAYNVAAHAGKAIPPIPGIGVQAVNSH